MAVIQIKIEILPRTLHYHSTQRMRDVASFFVNDLAVWLWQTCVTLLTLEGSASPTKPDSSSIQSDECNNQPCGQNIKRSWDTMECTWQGWLRPRKTFTASISSCLTKNSRVVLPHLSGPILSVASMNTRTIRTLLVNFNLSRCFKNTREILRCWCTFYFQPPTLQ